MDEAAMHCGPNTPARHGGAELNGRGIPAEDCPPAPSLACISVHGISCLDARRPWRERSPGELWAERTDRTADRDWSWRGWAPRPGVRARPSPVIAPSGHAGAGHYRPD